MTLTNLQQQVLVQLTLIYYGSGDVKDVYEEGTDIREDLVKAFKIEDTDDAIEQVLLKYSPIYEDWDFSLKLTTRAKNLIK